MSTPDFYNEIKKIISYDNRYHADAYKFVNDAVSYTIQKIKFQRSNKILHISGGELLDGIRELAIKQFGPMACEVFNQWGVKNSAAVGNIVFNMVKHNLLVTKETDSLNDFSGACDLMAALSTPFSPKEKTPDKLPIVD